MLRAVRSRLKKWYQGEPHINKPNDPVFIIGHYHRHWTSTYTHKLVKYLKKEYKFITATVLAVVGLIIAYLQLH